MHFQNRSLLLIILFILSISKGNSQNLHKGTQKMASRLQEIQQKADPIKNPFLNKAAAELIRKRLQSLLNQSKRSISQGVSLYFKYAYELLHSGKNQEAIEQFERLQDLIKNQNINLTKKQLDYIRIYTFLAHLRLGEQENCLERHTIDSCLLPISPRGFHKKPEGSQQAITLLEAFLKDHPKDLRAIWLLNIASMTLGEHPQNVPSHYRIPKKVFDSEFSLPPFKDVSNGLGLDLNSLAGSVVMDDFDNDHDLDLMISSMGLNDQLRLFINLGNGEFEDQTRSSGLIGELGGLNLIQADYDNDGNLDVFIMRGAWFEDQGNHPNSLLRNRGNARFEDVTEEAGMLSFHPTQTAVWLDFDGDGWLDLFIGNETSPNSDNPCELFHNQKDGTFREIAAEVGLVGKGMIKSVSSGDFNNDTRPDLYLSCQGQSNFLYRNDGFDVSSGKWKFTNVASTLNVEEPKHSFPSWFFDYDNDGWLDIFSCGYGISNVGSVAADYLGLPHRATRPRLYHNRGNGTFEDVTRSSGLYRLILGMAGNYGDLDNDGFLDFYIGTGTPQLEMIVPNRMFRNHQGMLFQDVTTAGRFGHIQKGHGIAFGDIDHDGDQDIYTSLGGAYEGDTYFNALFENPGTQCDWIKIRLEGTQSNRSAIGARLRLIVHSQKGSRAIHRVIGSGGSFGASPLRQEIGLGKDVETIDLRVKWPGSERVQEFEGLFPNRLYIIREGDANAKIHSINAFQFYEKPHHKKH